MITAWRGNIEIVNLLIDKDANVYLKDKSLRSVFELSKNLETIKFIVNKAGITPDSVLHFANNPNFFLIFPKQKK